MICPCFFHFYITFSFFFSFFFSVSFFFLVLMFFYQFFWDILFAFVTFEFKRDKWMNSEHIQMREILGIYESMIKKCLKEFITTSYIPIRFNYLPFRWFNHKNSKIKCVWIGTILYVWWLLLGTNKVLHWLEKEVIWYIS